MEEANSTESTDDLVLVQRAQQEDMIAYDELVRRYQERVYATIYHMTGNHEDAVDLAQEAFIKGFQALKSFKGDSSFYTWVYRIAVNKTINFLKSRRNKSHLSLNDMDFNARTVSAWQRMLAQFPDEEAFKTWKKNKAAKRKDD